MKEKICQSCGMPLEREEEIATNEDGSLNTEYCIYCYKDGVFTDDCTMEEMIENNLEYLDEFNKENETNYNKEEASKELKSFLSTLKRWSNN